METTLCNLQGFTNEVLEILRGLFDNAYIPDNPDINPAIFPYVTVYAADGITVNEPQATQKDLTNVTIAVVVPLKDIAWATSFLLPYREQIPMALYKWFYESGQQNSKHAQHIGTSISVVMSPIEWPQGQQMYGYLITLNEVKIQNDI